MKNFVKALDREGRGFAFLHQKFQQKSMEKFKAGIFDGPQIRELIKNTSFDNALNPAELSVWLSLKSVIVNFLGNHRSSQYWKVVDELMENFRQIGARMSVKMHFLRSHLDYFPENCGDFREEQDERFHQDISDMEKRYQFSGWLLLVPEEGCGVCSPQTEVPEETIHPWVASLVHYTLLAAFSKYFVSRFE